MAGETGTQEVTLAQSHDGVSPNAVPYNNDVPPPGSGVREDIDAAIKELEGNEATPDADGENAGADEPQQEAEGANAQPHDEGAGETAQEAAPEEAQQEPEAQPEPTGLEPPEAWPDEQKTAFAELPEPQRKFMLDRFKDMESAHTKRTQAIAPTLEVARKWSPYLQARGMTADKALDNLVATEYALSTGTQEQKQGMFLQLMQTYGVDPVEVATQAEERGEGETEVDPGMRRLLEPVTQSVQDLHRRMDAREAQGTQQQQMADLDSFAQAKDADGNLLHPHFEELVDDMLALAQARAAVGQRPTYEDLYEAAQWSNPTVRERLLNARSVEERKAAGQQHANARRAAVQGAKENGTKVNGQPGERISTALVNRA